MVQFYDMDKGESEQESDLEISLKREVKGSESQLWFFIIIIFMFSTWWNLIASAMFLCVPSFHTAQ